MFKYIIWDFDGTLYDTYPGIVQAFEDALEDLGVKEDRENIFKQTKISVRYARRYFADKYSLDENSLGKKYYEYGERLDPDIMKPFPHAREICSHFKRIGGKNFIYTHRDDGTFKYLKHHDMLDYFDDVITSTYGFVKPSPGGFLHIIEKHSLEKKDGLGVGDRDLDIIAAERAGLKTCLVDNDGMPYESRPDFVIGSLEELNQILGLK